jgi:hypothetical protein
VPIPRFIRPNADRAVGSFSGLHNESLNDEMPYFQDIEILPNIVVDQEKPNLRRDIILQIDLHSPATSDLSPWVLVA